MKELLFILTDSLGVETTLDHSPDGWDESFIVTERSKKYHGIFRSFTIPLKFVKDGAEIIRREFYTRRYTDCSILVQKLNKTTLTYFDAFTGKIDFTTFKDHDYSVEVTAIDGGLAQLIKSNETTEYEFNASNGYLKIDYPTPGVFVPIYRTTPQGLFFAIIDELTGGKLTDGTYGIKYDYLGPVGNWLQISTGQAWRNYPGASTDVIFKTTLADVFASLDAVLCLGMGIEMIGGKETIVIENRRYFYNESVIYDVGNSTNLSLGFVADFNFKKIVCGYPEKNYNDESLSQFEVCTYSNFETPNIPSQGKYDIQSKFRGDMYSLLQIADTWFSTPTDDDEVDYDIYFHHVFKNNAGDFLMDVGSLFQSSVFKAYVYNSKITPKRNLLRHFDFICSCCYKLVSDDIVFTSGGNKQSINEVIETFEPSTDNNVTEYGPIPISDGQTWFRPLELNIEAAYPSTFVNLIAANPYGLIQFEYLGNSYKGYILKMETKLSGAGSVKYSLLSYVDNELTKLIR